MNNIYITRLEDAYFLTHGGVFHADDVFATVLLGHEFDTVKLARVFKVPEEGNFERIFDIGGGSYDHHQKDAPVRENGIKYAACGLLWDAFGGIVLTKMGCPENILEAVWKEVEETLIQGIDAVDNGQPLPDRAIPVSRLISVMNPNWDSSMTSDGAFLKAVDLADTIFCEIVDSAISKVKAEEIVRSAAEAAEGHTMILDSFVPWTDTLFKIAGAEDIWYVIFPSNRGGFNCQCVPDAPGSFGQRHPIPEEWRGNPSATGIEGCNFVHNTGFIAGFDTKEASVEFANSASRR